MKCPAPAPQEMVQEIVSEDDHEEKTLQSDAETGKKVTSNDAYILAEHCDDGHGTDTTRV